jgi:hypothetical protein
MHFENRKTGYTSSELSTFVLELTIGHGYDGSQVRRRLRRCRIQLARRLVPSSADVTDLQLQSRRVVAFAFQRF